MFTLKGMRMWTVRSSDVVSDAATGRHVWRCLTADVGGDAAGADLLVAQDLGVEECSVAVAGR